MKPAKQKAKKTAESSSESEEDEDAKLAERMHKKSKKSQSAQDAKKDSDDGSEDSDDEGDPSNLVHESLLKGEKTKGQSRHGKAKFAPSEETPEQRDARTIFVGNVAIEVTKSRVSVMLSVYALHKLKLSTAYTKAAQAAYTLVRPLC